MYHILPYLTISLLLMTKGQLCPNQGRECNPGECCSKWGYCGTGDAYCNAESLYRYTGTSAPDCPDCECEQCPICPGENRTLSPTPAPVVEPVFDSNCHCKCWGDPHCQMWNCAINNYQGPHRVSPPGSFYYMTPCEGRGYSHDDIPFDVIGVHQRYDNDFTSFDYTVLKLYNGDDVYCVKTKGNFGVSYNTDCGDDYPEKPDEGETVTLGNKFEIKYEETNGAIYLYLNVLGDDDCNTDLTIVSTTATVREEGVQFKVSDCYKRYTCGMCGNFYDEGLHFQRLDGKYMWLSEGCWGGTANRDDGLSYLVPGTMGRRRLAENDDDNLSMRRLAESEPCYGKLDDIEVQCSIEIGSYSECCDSRAEFCDTAVVEGCKWDACSCVNGYDEVDVTDQVIEECAADTIAAAMNFTCILPADDFVYPESLVAEETAVIGGSGECESDATGNIFIGIAIGCVIFIVIDLILYFVCIKAKMDQARNGYGGVNLNDSSANEL